MINLPEPSTESQSYDAPSFTFLPTGELLQNIFTAANRYFPRNGYPSLLIVNDQRHVSCNNLAGAGSPEQEPERINRTSYQVKLGRPTPRRSCLCTDSCLLRTSTCAKLKLRELL